jgi:hypothetical protein
MSIGKIRIKQTVSRTSSPHRPDVVQCRSLLFHVECSWSYLGIWAIDIGGTNFSDRLSTIQRGGGRRRSTVAFGQRSGFVAVISANLFADVSHFSFLLDSPVLVLLGGCIEKEGDGNSKQQRIGQEANKREDATRRWRCMIQIQDFVRG